MPQPGWHLLLAVLPATTCLAHAKSTDEEFKLLGVDLEGQLVIKEALESPWARALANATGPHLLDVAVLQDGTLVGVGSDFGLHTYDPDTGNWAAVPNSLKADRGEGDYEMWNPITIASVPLSEQSQGRDWDGGVLSVTQLQDGTIVGAGRHDLELYKMAKLGDPWEHVPSSGVVIAVAAEPGGGLLGLSEHSELARKETLEEQGWAGGRDDFYVRSVAALPDDTYAVLGHDLQVYLTDSVDDDEAELEQLDDGDEAAKALSWVRASNARRLFPQLAEGK